MKFKAISKILLVMLIGMACATTQAQVQSWGYAQPLIQSLDQQLENFAATEYDSQDKVLIARACIRTRVLARDLLVSGLADPSDAGISMVFYGTMIYEHLKALDELYAQLPNLPALQRDKVTPTKHQRRTYTLLKPALERFSQNPISKLKLNVFYPGQVRLRVSQAFAPLADALQAAGYPLIRSTWQHPSASLLKPSQLDQLTQQFLALKNQSLPVAEILQHVKPALKVQEFRPLVYESYQLMSQIVRVLEILKKQDTAFIQANPLINESLLTGLSNYQNPKQRVLGLKQLNRVLIFDDAITRMDQLQDQFQDTLPYEKLLAVTIAQPDHARLKPIAYWIKTVLDTWLHVRMKSHSPSLDFTPAYQLAIERWEQLRSKLIKLTEQMTVEIPLTLNLQYLNQINACHQIRVLFDDLHQLPLLISHQAAGSFKSLKTAAQTLLQQTHSEDTSQIQEALSLLLSLSKQWQQAIDISAYNAIGSLESQQKITTQITTDINQWLQLWQSPTPNADHASEKLNHAKYIVQNSRLLNKTIHASKHNLFQRLGLIDLNNTTLTPLLALIPTHINEVSRLYVQNNNRQDLKLNEDRLEENLSFILALGEIALAYEQNVPSDLNMPASQVLSRLIWQLIPREYDTQLIKLCTRLSLLCREWCYQRQQDAPRHRRELMTQMREIGNKIRLRLADLN
ncbi:MAG: hypothetical protein JKX85_09550, partial [Phycisphaeraceae bacterium]|nr:hypothetical protein [Phycisphaeraceae bacterium]